MELRITFRSEVYISGETIGEIYRKFAELPIEGFVELVSVEDAETFKDMMDEFNDD